MIDTPMRRGQARWAGLTTCEATADTDAARRHGFWHEAFALQGSITPHVIRHIVAFGFIATVVAGAAWLVEDRCGVQIGLEVAPFEVAGVVLGLLLILRTNAGYDRWWEARTLWGGIVNQSRNVAIGALSYGPADAAWRDRFVRWAAVYPHVVRSSLRRERLGPEVAGLVGAEAAALVERAPHMPSFAALRLAKLLREARASSALDGFAFMQLDRERAQLIDHVGACERILNTPLPRVCSMKIRSFIALFLLMLPFALLYRTSEWLVPFVTMLVAYPLMALDRIGVELQNPFSTRNVSHLPLDDLCAMIERNLTDLLQATEGSADERSRPG